jgi:hypothetical protein
MYIQRRRGTRGGPTAPSRFPVRCNENVFARDRVPVRLSATPDPARAPCGRAPCAARTDSHHRTSRLDSALRLTIPCRRLKKDTWEGSASQDGKHSCDVLCWSARQPRATRSEGHSHDDRQPGAFAICVYLTARPTGEAAARPPCLQKKIEKRTQSRPGFSIA